jgi:hypothetical protein
MSHYKFMKIDQQYKEITTTITNITVTIKHKHNSNNNNKKQLKQQQQQISQQQLLSTTPSSSSSPIMTRSNSMSRYNQGLTLSNELIKIFSYLMQFSLYSLPIGRILRSSNISIISSLAMIFLIHF